MRRPSVRSAFLLLTGGSLVWLAGCGGSDIVSVSGTLTYKGKPVTNAYVNFAPETGRPSSGATDEQGRFTLLYDPQTKGAQRGKHKVFVIQNVNAVAPNALPGVTAKTSPDMKDFFDKYSGEKSKVEVTIDKATDDLKLDWD
jgi:hypothetical protein